MVEEEKSNNQKTKSGFDVADSQEPGFDEMLKEYIDNLDDDENPFLNPDNDLFASNDDGEMTIEDYQNYIDDFKKNGFFVYAADMGGDNYREVDFADKVLLIIGNEGHGISRLVGENCDQIIAIPQYGKINSLNASVAAAILIYGIVNR